MAKDTINSAIDAVKKTVSVALSHQTKKKGGGKARHKMAAR